jgi:hypothetical protein
MNLNKSGFGVCLVSARLTVFDLAGPFYLWGDKMETATQIAGDRTLDFRMNFERRTNCLVMILPDKDAGRVMT